MGRQKYVFILTTKLDLTHLWYTEIKHSELLKIVMWTANHSALFQHSYATQTFVCDIGSWTWTNNPFVCAYHPAAPGSNPKHTNYAFFNLYYWNCNGKRTKINKKRPEKSNPFVVRHHPMHHCTLPRLCVLIYFSFHYKFGQICNYETSQGTWFNRLNAFCNNFFLMSFVFLWA